MMVVSVVVVVSASRGRVIVWIIRVVVLIVMVSSLVVWRPATARRSVCLVAA